MRRVPSCSLVNHHNVLPIAPPRGHSRCVEWCFVVFCVGNVFRCSQACVAWHSFGFGFQISGPGSVVGFVLIVVSFVLPVCLPLQTADLFLGYSWSGSRWCWALALWLVHLRGLCLEPRLTRRRFKRVKLLLRSIDIFNLLVSCSRSADSQARFPFSHLSTLF